MSFMAVVKVASQLWITSAQKAFLATFWCIIFKLFVPGFHMAISKDLSEDTEVQSHLNDHILGWQINGFPCHEIRGHKGQFIFKDWIETLHIGWRTSQRLLYSNLYENIHFLLIGLKWTCGSMSPWSLKVKCELLNSKFTYQLFI